MLTTSVWYLLSISNVFVDKWVSDLLLPSADVRNLYCDTQGSHGSDYKDYNFGFFGAV